MQGIFPKKRLQILQKGSLEPFIRIRRSLSFLQSSIWEILIGLFMKKEMKSTGYFYIVQDLLFPFRLPAR
ncbi:Uncharacterised protein [Mycobacteroides abscessus subsp. abscessus]|nr:Uncharacterised protein [Mycobacteroides abscessus subsp. abscessus]